MAAQAAQAAQQTCKCRRRDAQEETAAIDDVCKAKNEQYKGDETNMTAVLTAWFHLADGLASGSGAKDSGAGELRRNHSTSSSIPYSVRGLARWGVQTTPQRIRSAQDSLGTPVVAIPEFRRASRDVKNTALCL